MKVELDLSNYARNADLKNLTGINTSRFDKKFYLVNIKKEVHKVGIGKLQATPVDLSI